MSAPDSKPSPAPPALPAPPAPPSPFSPLSASPHLFSWLLSRAPPAEPLPPSYFSLALSLRLSITSSNSHSLLLTPSHLSFSNVLHGLVHCFPLTAAASPGRFIFDPPTNQLFLYCNPPRHTKQPLLLSASAAPGGTLRLHSATVSNHSQTPDKAIQVARKATAFRLSAFPVRRHRRATPSDPNSLPASTLKALQKLSHEHQEPALSEVSDDDASSSHPPNPKTHPSSPTTHNDDTRHDAKLAASLEAMESMLTGRFILLEAPNKQKKTFFRRVKKQQTSLMILAEEQVVERQMQSSAADQYYTAIKPAKEAPPARDMSTSSTSSLREEDPVLAPQMNATCVT